MLNILNLLSNVILTKICEGKYYYNCQVTDEDDETWRGQVY